MCTTRNPLCKYAFCVDTDISQIISTNFEHCTTLHKGPIRPQHIVYPHGFVTCYIMLMNINISTRQYIVKFSI